MNRLAKYAWGVLVYNLGVVLWGAYVRATGSGAGCGSHWPLCNGDVVPREPQIETIIEFTHRATSGVALLAVLGLFLWARRDAAPGHPVRTGALLSLIFIIIEALLGAGLVLFELVADDASSLRAFSMVAHLVNTFILLAMLTLTAWWASGGPPLRRDPPPLEKWLILGSLIGLLAVGGTGAIAALGDTLFPAESLQQGLRDSFSRESHPLVQLRKYHPLIAILVGLLVAGAAKFLARSHDTPIVRRLSLAVVVLYGVQLIAGATNIILLAPIWLQLLHLLLADFVWIAVVLLGAAVLAQPAGHELAPQRARARNA